MSEKKTRVTLREKIVLSLVGLSLCGMLLVFLVDRLTHPSLVVEVAHPPKSAPQPMMADSEGIGELMRRLQQNPHDVALMNSVAEGLMNAEQWDAAATFVDRALAEDKNNFTANFLHGIILHKKGQYADAAKALEKSIVIKDDARARYSAAVLYLYFLKNKEMGRKHLEAGLSLPDLPKDMRELFEKELRAIEK